MASLVPLMSAAETLTDILFELAQFYKYMSPEGRHASMKSLVSLLWLVWWRQQSSRSQEACFSVYPSPFMAFGENFCPGGHLTELWRAP